MRNTIGLAMPTVTVGLWLLGLPSGQCYYNSEPRNGAEVSAVDNREGGRDANCSEGAPLSGDLRTPGRIASANPFRFSPNYRDDETEVLYYGYRYLNTSTGRWITRDPLGELTFFKKIAELNAQLQDVNLYYTSSHYVFAVNDAPDFIDYVGLLRGGQQTVTIPDCQIVIYAGHGFLDSAFDPSGKLKNPKAINDLPFPHILKGNPQCSGGAIIACNAAKFASVQDPIPGVTLNNTEVSVLAGIVQLDNAVASAEVFAHSICEHCCGCDTVKIKVNCFPPFHKPTFWRSGSPNCGETITVDCVR